MGHDSEPSPEYVEARRVLLDAVEALGPQSQALVLAGAQAVYIHTGPGSLPIAEHTTDGDIVIDPTRLKDAPPLEELMRGAGFELFDNGGGSEPGIWQKPVVIDGVNTAVPIDLIVPTGAASPAGRRGARLGPHGNRAARKTLGLEAALVDSELRQLHALDPLDRRTYELRVAGVAALFVAKAHKLMDRMESDREDRLDDKDAADVYRLMGDSSPSLVGHTLDHLLHHPMAGAATRSGIAGLMDLFGTRAGAGIAMAARSLRGSIPRGRISEVCVSYCEVVQSCL